MQPTYTSRERTADAVVHVAGVAIALVAVGAMLAAALASLPVSSTATLAIYGAAMLAMFGLSAAYHMVDVAHWKSVLRRLDHAAIFLKIAATYTPFALLKIGGSGGYALLISVWSIALFGAAGKLFLASTWDRLAVPLYLALGWAGVVMFEPLAASVTLPTLLLLGIGGALYTVGVAFHLWRRLPYQNAIWHLFVLAGTGCQFGAVTTAVFG